MIVNRDNCDDSEDNGHFMQNTSLKRQTNRKQALWSHWHSYVIQIDKLQHTVAIGSQNVRIGIFDVSIALLVMLYQFILVECDTRRERERDGERDTQRERESAEEKCRKLR